jgi:hypothetical protein
MDNNKMHNKHQHAVLRDREGELFEEPRYETQQTRLQFAIP